MESIWRRPILKPASLKALISAANADEVPPANRKSLTITMSKWVTVIGFPAGRARRQLPATTIVRLSAIHGRHSTKLVEVVDGENHSLVLRDRSHAGHQ